MCWGSRAQWRWDDARTQRRERPVSRVRDVTSDTLRIGDAERGQAAEELKRHCSDGRLTLDEYSERLDEVFAARTYADLARALRDLPGPLRLTDGTSRTDRRRGFSPQLPRGPKVVAVLVVIWALTGAGAFFWPAVPLFIFGVCLLRRADYARSRYTEPPPSGREDDIRV